MRVNIAVANMQIPTQQQQQQARAQASTPPESSDAVWKSHSWVEGGHTFHSAQSQPYQQPSKSQNYQPTTKSQIYQTAPKQENYQQQPPRIGYLPYEPSASPTAPAAKPVKKVKKKPSRLTKEQVDTLMRSLKNVDSGQSYWQCIKCDYFSANPKSSKYRVERHILNKHPLDCAQPTMWVEGRPITINVTPQLYHPLPTSISTTNAPTNSQGNSELAKTEEMARAENLCGLSRIQRQERRSGGAQSASITTSPRSRA